jgi:2-polyprenyl-3-methyl-5-hydroxy-6-metoxy-1,4-benzoquinol methylase
MNVNFRVAEYPCIACNTSYFLQFYKSDKRVEVAQNEVLVFEQDLECCYCCGLVRQKNNDTYSDTNLSKYYSQTFRTPVQPPLLTKEDKRVQNAKKRLQFIKKLKSRGTLLEVGFGDGVFLQMAAKDFLCMGLDPSTGYGHVRELLRKKGIEIFDKSLEKIPAKRKFNVVCSFLVLEHIKDPLAFIRHQIKHLSPNGIGFSLIAAFKVVKKVKSTIAANGFEVLAAFDRFFESRDLYQRQMATAIDNIVKEAHDRNQSVAVYGTGFLFNYAIECCAMKLTGIDFLFDDTKEKIGASFFGKIIKPLAEINNCTPGVVMIFSEMFFEPMKSKVLDLSVDKNVRIENIHQLPI